jgi:hypothetical protein
MNSIVARLRLAINTITSQLCSNLTNNLGDKSLQLGRSRAYNLAIRLAILEDFECGHGADVELLGDIRRFIDVDSNEVDFVSVLLS